MVGDSNVFSGEGKWWLYFKGKKSDEKPWETHIGVAVSDAIKGPYEIHPSSPLFDGHAFSAWKHRGGVAISPRKILARGIVVGEWGGFYRHRRTVEKLLYGILLP